MNPYAEIGALLRSAREEKRISLGDAAHRLHIRTRYLLALEDGDIASLPGLPYAKGYLKRYISLLNLDQTEVMRRFELSQREARTPFFFLPHTFSQAKQTTPFVALMSPVVAFGVLVIWLSFSGAYHDAPALVEPLPALVQTPSVNPRQTGQNPCLSRYDKLYPPCYYAEPTKSILYLPDWPRKPWR